MAVKVYDVMTTATDAFPLAYAEKINIKKTDGSEVDIQSLYNSGELGGSGGTAYVELSQNEYDALTDEEKVNGTEYRTYDTGHIYRLGIEYGKDACFTSLSQLELTADATIQDVRDALPIGGTALLRTDEFANWSTLFNGIKHGYLKVEKTINGLSNMELQEVIKPIRRYFGTQPGGKFNEWQQVASGITDVLTNNSSINQVPNAKLMTKEIYGRSFTINDYSDALTMPAGKWRVDTNNKASKMQNLPVPKAGILEVKYLQGNDGTTAYTGTRNYAMLTYTDINGNIYKRSFNSDDTVGNIVNDTGWQKLATETQLDELFQSVSSGKTLVANAITGKGVSTATDATFATMATNISKISGCKEETKSYDITSSSITPITLTFSNDVSGVKKVMPPTYSCRIVTQTSGDIFTINGKELTFYVTGAGTWEVTALIKA